MRITKNAARLAAAAMLSALALCAGARAYDAPGIYVDGKRADAAGLAEADGGTAWVPFRDTARALGAAVIIWDPASMTAEAEADGLHITAAVGAKYIVANGRYLYVHEGCRVGDGYILVPARTLAKAFGAAVTWDDGGAVRFRTGGPPIEPGGSWYREEDVYWLSRLIFAEAGGESFAGQIAVGNVVMNRVGSGDFPDTVRDVIFDRRFGVQFTPAYSGAIYNTPTESCVAAAKLALDGADVVGDCMYFSSAGVSCWAGRNREFVTRIENQIFYA